MTLWDLGVGKFQEFSREMGRAGLEDKAAGTLPQSLFLPGVVLNQVILFYWIHLSEAYLHQSE